MIAPDNRTQRSKGFSPRLNIWLKEARAEIGRMRRKFARDYAILPRRFYKTVAQFDQAKKYDFCFIGAYKTDPATEKNRRWLIDFVRDRFSVRSYLQFTDRDTRATHVAMGDYDHTLGVEGYVPKEQARTRDRGHFDRRYYEIMCQSRFILCPAGDAMWSMRFYEALMCKAVPIVSSKEETYRTDAESRLDYKYFLNTDELKFDVSLVEHNYQLFLKHHTFDALPPVR